MMKLAGHTMGTPEYSLCDAIRLFKCIGLDGVEIVVQDGYECGINEETSRERLKEIKELTNSLGMKVSALTPYFSRFNSLDMKIRDHEIEGIKRVIDYANYLEAKNIRIYGGNYSHGEEDRTGEKRKYLVESMKILGRFAEQAGVKLVIENHFNTMTVSAKESISISKEINSSAVGILYDQANLTFTNNEEFTEAIPLQIDKIFYTHVKDLMFKSTNHTFKSDDVSHPKESDRNVETRIVGKGCLPWPQILQALNTQGYNGWLSLEYERRWHPLDIPDACIGMKESANYIYSLLQLLK